jgi:exonuclease I
MLVPLSTPLPDPIVETDWSEYAVVDLVEFLPATTTKFEDDHLRTEVYRYRERAPPRTVYENGERRYRLHRATRPLVERL